ncbi:MAG: flagellum-specific ATP synthase FliI, partial [Leptospiraceae bacterium]|nr:flagellum-specific ATP synthase FliI [Leptospiraceae bacterium]
EQLMFAGLTRELISIYEDSEELIKLNAYVKGSDPKTDISIEKKNIIDEFLKQKIEERSSYTATLSSLKNIFKENKEEVF